MKVIHASQAGAFLLGGELSIYRMGFGALHLPGPGSWGEPKDRRKAQAVLKRAIELGINFIDTADSYGPEVSENIIAEALHPYPRDLVIATKGGLVRPGQEGWLPLGRPEYLIQCVEMSLRRLRIDCIALYQLHAVDPTVPIEESVGALNEMHRQGKIRHIGLSNVSVSEIERARKVAKIVSVQNEYNIADRQSENVVSYCEKHQMAFIPWAPIGRGVLGLSGHHGYTGAQIALAWLLRHSKVMVPIPGTASIAHLEENVAAAAITDVDVELGAKRRA